MDKCQLCGENRELLWFHNLGMMMKICEQCFEKKQDRRRKRDDDLRPNYYMLPGGIECRDVVQHYDFNTGAAIKYLWRHGKKPGQDAKKDLLKAIKQIEFRIQFLEEQEKKAK